jgi:hypothetical protein
LKRLGFTFSEFSDADILTLSLLLRHTSRKELSLIYSGDFADEGCIAITDALGHNTSLQSVHLFGDYRTGDRGRVAFSQMLMSNTTLSAVDLGFTNEHELNAFMSCLPSMRGLTKLSIDTWLASPDLLISQNRDIIRKALEANTGLVQMKFSVPMDKERRKEIERKVDYKTALNRGGKRILKYEGHVSSALWSHIIARSSNTPNILYFFLREEPDVLVNNPLVHVSEVGCGSSLLNSSRN